MDNRKVLKVSAGAILIMVLVSTVSYLAVMILFGPESLDYFRKRMHQPAAYLDNFWRFWSIFSLFLTANLWGFHAGFTRFFPPSSVTGEEEKDLSKIKSAFMVALLLGTIAHILLRQDVAFYNSAG